MAALPEDVHSPTLGSYAPVRRDSTGGKAGRRHAAAATSSDSDNSIGEGAGNSASGRHGARVHHLTGGASVATTEPAGDPRPETGEHPRLRLQHGTVVPLNHPLTESQFKRRLHMKKSRYKKVAGDARGNFDGGNGSGSDDGGRGRRSSSEGAVGAHAGKAVISSVGRQTCLQYMLACAARREWSFWSTTTFFIGCWINITLAGIDIIGETFGEPQNVTRNYTDFTDNGTTIVSYVVTEYVYTNDELALYEADGSAYNWLNIISCTLFVVNPVFDWLYAFFNQPGFNTALQAPRTWQYLNGFAWGLWCPLWFFLASILYLTSALDGIWNWRRTEDLLILNIWASHLFVVDAVCSIIVWRLGQLRAKGTRDEVFMCSRHFEKIDWCGWGDWLFLAGAVTDSSNAYVYEVAYSLADRANFFGSILWTLDCVCYFIADKVAKDQAKRAHISARHLSTNAAATGTVTVRATTTASDTIPTAVVTVKKGSNHAPAGVVVDVAASPGAASSSAPSSLSSSAHSSPAARAIAADIVAQDFELDLAGDSDSSV